MSNVKVLEIDRIVENMIAFQSMAGSFDETMKKHIDHFSEFAYAFYTSAMKSISQEDYLRIVKDFVIELNQLNELTDYALIETDEREQIYLLIDYVSKKRGYIFEYDITEDVREW